eukprot:6211424-Pleurochrysis_carterae.AAC.3
MMICNLPQQPQLLNVGLVTASCRARLPGAQRVLRAAKVRISCQPVQSSHQHRLKPCVCRNADQSVSSCNVLRNGALMDQQSYALKSAFQGMIRTRSTAQTYVYSLHLDLRFAHRTYQGKATSRALIQGHPIFMNIIILLYYQARRPIRCRIDLDEEMILKQARSNRPCIDRHGKFGCFRGTSERISVYTDVMRCTITKL